jgi:uncharacterized membrane protein YeaQ/YmgE (transglycosylase-associated protein family)
VGVLLLLVLALVLVGALGYGLLNILFVALGGLVVGALARLAFPGPDPMTMLQTTLVGVAGSLVAGFVGLSLFGRGGGILLSVLCTMGIVYAVRRSRGGTLTRPGPPGGRPRVRR